MNKKKYNENNAPGISELYNELVRTTRGTGKQTPATEEEAEARKALRQTRGRKGVHLPRINMAFSPVNYDFIKTMALITGQTMTDYVNNLIESYRNEYAEEYDFIINLRKQFKKGETK